MRVRNLVRSLAPINVAAPGAEAFARFSEDPHLLAVAVVNAEGAPRGLLTRAGFALKMADRFGRALYEKRPVSILLEREPLTIDVEAPLGALNALILGGGDGSLLDGFIGLKDGRYFGVGTGLDVLRATADAAAGTAKRLAAEREKSKIIEAALLDLFRSADALAADKRAALAGKGAVAERATPTIVPTQLGDLLPHIERLFAEIRMRDEALLQALEAAEAASRAKTQFLANTSHELRTPLNAIIGYAELLEEVAGEDGNGGVAKDAKRIASAGKHLLRLINDILDMSKIEAGKVQLCIDEFDLGAVIHEAVATVAPQAHANATRLHTDIDPAIAVARTDGLRVRQCLLNLLANAVKFTRGGSVVMRARLLPLAQGEVVRIDVIDTGIGMSAEEVSRLFQPFVQASGKTTQTYGGTGLGLAITRRLVRMLGGDVTVTSAHGVGSCFTMSFPVHLLAAQAEAA